MGNASGRFFRGSSTSADLQTTVATLTMDVCEDAEADIYYDLPDFRYDETLDELKATINQLEADNLELERKLSQMIEEKERLEGNCNALNTNISSLMKTARREIDRKERTINDLRRRLNTTVGPRKRFGVKRTVASRCEVDSDIANKRLRTEEVHNERSRVEDNTKPTHFDSTSKYSRPSGYERDVSIRKHNDDKQLNHVPSPSVEPLKERDYNNGDKLDSKVTSRKEMNSVGSDVQAPTNPPPMNCRTLYSSRMYKKEYQKTDVEKSEVSRALLRPTKVEVSSEGLLVEESAKVVEQLESSKQVSEKTSEIIKAVSRESEVTSLQISAKQIVSTSIASEKHPAISHLTNNSVFSSRCVSQWSASESNNVSVERVVMSSSKMPSSAKSDACRLKKPTLGSTEIQVEQSPTTNSSVKPSRSTGVTGVNAEVAKPSCPLSLPTLNTESSINNASILGDGLLTVSTPAEIVSSVELSAPNERVSVLCRTKSAISDAPSSLPVLPTSSGNTTNDQDGVGLLIDANEPNIKKRVSMPNRDANCSLKLPSSLKGKGCAKKMFAPISNQWNCSKPLSSAHVEVSVNINHNQRSGNTNELEDGSSKVISSTPEINESKSDDVADQVMQVFGGSIDDISSDSVKVDGHLSVNPRSKIFNNLFGSSPSKNGDSCSSESPANINLPPGAYEDSCCTNLPFDKVPLLNKCSPLSRSDVLPNRVPPRDKSSESGSKSTDHSDERDNVAFLPPVNPVGKKLHSMFSPLKDSKSSHNQDKIVVIEDRSSTGLCFPFKALDKYEDSVLGHFDDTAQFSSALAKPYCKISPLNTPMKATDIEDDSITCPAPNNPTSFTEVFQNKALQDGLSSSKNHDPSGMSNKVTADPSKTNSTDSEQNQKSAGMTSKPSSSQNIDQEKGTVVPSNVIEVTNSSSNPVISTKFIHRSNFSSSSVFTVNSDSQSNLDRPVNVLQPRKTPRMVTTQNRPGSLKVDKEVKMNSRLAIDDAFITDQEVRVIRWYNANMYENTAISSCASPRSTSPSKSPMKIPSPKRGKVRSPNKFHLKTSSPKKAQFNGHNKNKLRTSSPVRGTLKSSPYARKKSPIMRVPSKRIINPIKCTDQGKPIKTGIESQRVITDNKIADSADTTLKNTSLSLECRNICKSNGKAVYPADRSIGVPASVPPERSNEELIKTNEMPQQSVYPADPARTWVETQTATADDDTANCGKRVVGVPAIVAPSMSYNTKPVKPNGILDHTSDSADPVLTGVEFQKITVDDKIAGSIDISSAELKGVLDMVSQNLSKSCMNRKDCSGTEIATATPPSRRINRKSVGMCAVFKHSTDQIDPLQIGIQHQKVAADDDIECSTDTISKKSTKVQVPAVMPGVPMKTNAKSSKSKCEVVKSKHQSATIGAITKIIIKKPITKKRDFKKSSSLKNNSIKPTDNIVHAQHSNSISGTLPEQAESKNTPATKVIPSPTIPVLVRRKSAPNFQTSFERKEFHVISGSKTQPSLLDKTEILNVVQTRDLNRTNEKIPINWIVHPIDFHVPKDIYNCITSSFSPFDPRAYSKLVKRQDDLSCMNRTELGENKATNAADVEFVKLTAESSISTGFSSVLSPINLIQDKHAGEVRRPRVSPEMATSTPLLSKSSREAILKKSTAVHSVQTSVKSMDGADTSQSRVPTSSKENNVTPSKRLVTRSGRNYGKTILIEAPCIRREPKRRGRPPRQQESTTPRKVSKPARIPDIEDNLKSPRRSSPKLFDSCSVKDNATVISSSTSSKTPSNESNNATSSIVSVPQTSSLRPEDQSSSLPPRKIIKLNKTRNINFCNSDAQSLKVVVSGKRPASFSASQ